MMRYRLVGALLLVMTATVVAGEHSLTGEYAASLSFGRKSKVRVVYQATIRQRGRFSANAGSTLTLSGDPDTPDKGHSGLLVYGGLDLFGTSKDPVRVTGLNDARIKIGSVEGRDDLTKKAVLTRARVGFVVFRNVSFEVRNGAVDVKECVFIDAPVVVDGGAAFFSNCTFINSKGNAFEVLRSDTYPNVSLKYLEFVRSPLGLSIRKDTVREQRGQLAIGGCSFVDNEKDIFYDEVQHLLIQGCYLNGADGKTAQERFEYPDNPDRPGRILARSVLKNPPKQAGSKLTKAGVVRLPEPKDQEQAAQ